MSVTFRPSLTLAEIQFILDAIQASPCDESVMQGVRRKLEVFTLKAKHGITKPAHLRVGKQSEAAKLGFEDDTTMDTLLEFYNNPEAKELLSPTQLHRINFYRWQNDMMTPTEEAEFETTQR